MTNYKIQRVIAYALLTPAMLSVIGLVIYQLDNCEIYIGSYNTRFFLYGLYSNGESNFTPIYVGLMAIAGVYLLVNTKNE